MSQIQNLLVRCHSPSCVSRFCLRQWGNDSSRCKKIKNKKNPPRQNKKLNSCAFLRKKKRWKSTRQTGVQFQQRTSASVLGLKPFHHAYTANNFSANIWNAIHCNTLSDVFRNFASAEGGRLFGFLNSSCVRLVIFSPHIISHQTSRHLPR